MPKAKKVKLPNGLRVILVPRPSSITTTVLILVAAGSEYETKRVNGVSHFLEHLMFKGTVKRPKPGMIATELDSLGAEYNAFTGQEYTGYWAKAENRKVSKLLELVSDLYLNPIFIPEEIEKERGVIIEEINLYEDTPMRRVQDLFTALLYGDQPAGWDVAGTKEVIRRLKRNDFMRYRAAHYVPGKTVVVVAGDFNEVKVLKTIRRTFGNLPRKAKLEKPSTKEFQSRPKAYAKFKESDQSHLVVGVRAFDVFDRRKHALEVLANILGGGMSSRLFHRIREDLGAAYYIRASADFSLDHGFLAVSSGVQHAKFDVVLRAILEEFARARQTLVPAEELKKAKDHLIGTFLVNLETSDELAGFYGGQEILTRMPKEPSDAVRKIEAVTAEQVRDVARFVFADKKLNLAVIGPHRRPATILKHLHI